MIDFPINSNQASKLTCKDFTVSGKEFQLFYNEEFEMLITHPRPDEKELPKYYKSSDYISHTDSTESFTDKVFQYVKAKMIQRKLKWIEDAYPKKGRLLDIGAGTGEFLRVANKRGWKVEGVEPDENARQLAKKKGINLEKDLTLIMSEKFDIITLWHVMEHLPDLENKIQQVQQLLKEDGLLIIAVPNYNSYDARYYKQYWAAFDVPRHLWHFSKNSFSKLLSPYGFQKIASKPLIFDSFYVSILSERYKNDKNNFVSSFFVGLKSNFKAFFTGEYSSICYFFRKGD